MVARIGHIALRVKDLDRAVEFYERVIGLTQTERDGHTAYLTCNDRHHELILIEDRLRRGYDHTALEVSGPAALDAARAQIPAAGGRVLGTIFDGEPGIDRALLIAGPEGHTFKLFCGMERWSSPDTLGDGPVKFEHVSLKVRQMGRFERFLGVLGFDISDRMGNFASWWHCDHDHHGMALVWAPKPALSHYAYTIADLNGIGRIVDRLKNQRDRRLVWGVSRHGPGNNHFAYLKDDDGAMIELCSDIAQIGSGYRSRRWPVKPVLINKWGGPPPIRFLRSDFPIATQARDAS